jgi:hypothetical protein
VSWELVTTLPQGSASRTLLARRGEQVAVLRAVEGAAPVVPLAGADHVLALREVTVVAGARYAVYDLVAGLTLREVLDGFFTLGRTPPLGLVCTLVLGAARALAGLPQSTAHGGVSDHGLLVDCAGATHVLDFGAPRANRFQPAERPSPAGDVFALGAVLHAALTGYTGDYAVQAGEPLTSASASNPEVAPVLDDVLARALQSDPAARQADPGQLADELEVVTTELLFTTAEVARVLASVLEGRRAWLGRMLDGAADPTSATSPVLAVAAPAAPQARSLVPWTTGLTSPEMPVAPVIIPEDATGIIDPPPFEEALSPTVVRHPIPTGTVPAWGPPKLSPVVSRAADTDPSPTPVPTPEPQPDPQAATQTQPRVQRPAGLDERETVQHLEPVPEAVGEWGRVGERRRARAQENIPTAPLPGSAQRTVPLPTPPAARRSSSRPASRAAQPAPSSTPVAAIVAVVLVGIAISLGAVAVLAPQWLEPLRARLGHGAADASPGAPPATVERVQPVLEPTVDAGEPEVDAGTVTEVAAPAPVPVAVKKAPTKKAPTKKPPVRRKRK